MHYFATLIENSDLFDIGIDTEGYHYRIVEYFLLSFKYLLSTFFYLFKLLSIGINGTQVDFQAAIVGDSLSYSHYYEIQVNLFGSDVSGSEEFNGTCNPNPCKNGATCQIGFGNGFSCLCPSGFKGKKIFEIIYF